MHQSRLPALAGAGRREEESSMSPARRAKVWAWSWGVIAVLVPILGILNAALRQTGLAFTPRTSALAAAWLMLIVTVCLHKVVRTQLDPQAETGVAEAER